jgi:hypothetical protein
VASEKIADRAREFHEAGYGPLDALHLACAEAAGVDVLLTTDDGFVSKAARGHGRPRVAAQDDLREWINLRELLGHSGRKLFKFLRCHASDPNLSCASPRLRIGMFLVEDE